MHQSPSYAGEKLRQNRTHPKSDEMANQEEAIERDTPLTITFMTGSTSGDEMSSGAATRARQLLAAKESESFFSTKQRVRSPSTSPTNEDDDDVSLPRRTAGKIPVRTETMRESSSKVRDILSSMRRKRETFSSIVEDSKSGRGVTPSTASQKLRTSEQQGPSGKPPRFLSSTERDQITKRMSDSLREKRERISKMSHSDRQQRNFMSRSPHTVDTATTEDSQSSDGDSLTTHHLPWESPRTIFGLPS